MKILLKPQYVSRVLALLCAAFAVCLTQAQPAPGSIEAATDTAKRILPELKELVTKETFRDLGFDSPEVGGATLGKPLAVHMVRLDQLKEFKENAKADSLYPNVSEVLFPIAVGGQVRSGLTLREIQGKWQITSLGRSNLTRSLTQEIKHVEEVTHAESTFVVQVPAMGLYFIASRTRAETTLTPVISDVRFKLEGGRPLTAEKLMASLVPFAREIKTGQNLSD